MADIPLPGRNSIEVQADLFRLARRDYGLSMLLEPFGKHVGTDESDDGDLDALGREGAHFLAEKADAEADGVVTHIERAGLKNRARRIAGVARRAAA